MRYNKIYILKLGGSVVTDKQKKTMYIRRDLILSIAEALKSFLSEHPQTRLILIHGAGQPGHAIAKKYKLDEGVGDDEYKQSGAVLCHDAIHVLNTELSRIFHQAGLVVSPVHTASTVVQDGGRIKTCHTEVLEQILDHGGVPLMYGDMVWDVKQRMSVCSGDALAAYLATQFEVTKILFATDVDGIYDKDPYVHTDASCISDIDIDELLSSEHIDLSSSHHVDVTGGIYGKIQAISHTIKKTTVDEVIIFNGLKKENYIPALMGDIMMATKIYEGPRQ